MNARRTAAGWSAAACLAAGALAAPAAAEPPPCWTRTQVEPARVVPGEQILYRVLIASRERDVDRVEWVAHPSFPGVRTEPLGGSPRDGVVREGVYYRLRAEDRALFAERPGTVPLDGARIRCLVGGREIVVPVEPARLEVVPLPEAGRPEGFAGVVGPLAVQRVVTPRALALGGSVRVSVVVRGLGNLWDLPAPYASGDFPDADLFAERPVLRRVRGVELSVRRQFIYDVVPLREGSLRVPTLHVPYWDPRASRYRVASHPAVTVEVAPAPPPPAGRGGGEAGGAAPASAGTRRWLPVALGAGVALAVAALVGWRRARRPSAAADALAAARRARQAGDARAEAAGLERALRAVLARRLPEARDAAPDALLARADLAPDVAAALRALRDVERARFDPTAPPADSDAVARALSALDRRG